MTILTSSGSRSLGERCVFVALVELSMGLLDLRVRRWVTSFLYTAPRSDISRPRHFVQFLRDPASPARPVAFLFHPRIRLTCSGYPHQYKNHGRSPEERSSGRAQKNWRH